ncbi:hypothetical protein F5Y05DRAFT_417212 [Hypoxylon sp. FL0543]|nr:hypothetical protein F5Y05DRAFT_417212 [Hypoxylon sp. FL0543]
MAMSKRTTFTTISPLPPGITREVVVSFLHNHVEMIDLNPLVIERHPIAPPPHAPAEERRCVWWSMTDKISYLPGGVVSGDVTYTAAFNDLPDGIQTHVYAPMGTDIRERWTLNGSLPGEPPEPVELGINAPRQGLYLREDVELRCNFVMSSFVKKTLKKAHGTLVERLLQKAALTPGQGAGAGAGAVQHNHTGSSAHSGGARSNHSHSSGHHPAYPSPPHNPQYAAPYQQTSRPGSTNSYGHATPPPPPAGSAPYGHAHSASAGNGNTFVPEPLRINKRAGGGQYQPGGLEVVPGGQQQARNGGGWSGETNGYGGGRQAPRLDHGGGFPAELE